MACRVEDLCAEKQYANEVQKSSQGCADEDVLIVAGDVCDDLTVFRKTFEFLTSAYTHVFFTTGNHELWVRKKDRGMYDSVGKLQEFLRICEELGVKTGPTKVGDFLWIVPLWSWYHASWDKEPDIPGAYPIEKVMMDFHACDWSSVSELKASGDDSLAQYFDQMNEKDFSRIVEEIKSARIISEQKGIDGPVVVSFSHFLPHQELLPEKRWLRYPNLAKACGSDYLAERLRVLKPECHVYGHTHFTQDQRLQDGTRYVQWPLGYPREHSRRRNGGDGWKPLILWDVKEGHSPQKSTYWSDFYRANERKPHLINPAPYVATSKSSPKASTAMRATF